MQDNDEWKVIQYDTISLPTIQAPLLFLLFFFPLLDHLNSLSLYKQQQASSSPLSLVYYCSNIYFILILPFFLGGVAIVV